MRYRIKNFKGIFFSTFSLNLFFLLYLNCIKLIYIFFLKRNDIYDHLIIKKKIIKLIQYLMSRNIVSYDFFNKKVINLINVIQNYKKETM